ncbi:MAG: NUDIX hydrolase [Desulfobacterales bacterium]|nr:MAG: NUDIX hydrolase [Desulfobacterales bacterium]
MKRKGASILFINDQRQVLLFLRDNKPNLPYPNMWDAPGGHVEGHETPVQCIVREMMEEMKLRLDKFELFAVDEFSDRIEYTFWKRSNLDTAKIELNEGQELRWFTETEVKNTELAYGFNEIIENFFNQAPFDK